MCIILTWLCHLSLCSTAGTAAEPALSEATAADEADVQYTSSVRGADDAQVGSPTQEAVTKAVVTEAPTDKGVALGGAADAPTDTAVSTAVAADTADVTVAVFEGTSEPAQASSPQTEANNKAKTITAQQNGGASVPDPSSVDAHQTGIDAADGAAAGATAEKPVATANNAAAADAVVANAVADAVAVTDAAAKAATSPASTDGETDAVAAASMSHTAASEEGAASHDLAAAAAGPKFESAHTTVDSVPSSIKQEQTAVDSYHLSSKHAFAAAQYATGMAAMTLLTDCS